MEDDADVKMEDDTPVQGAVAATEHDAEVAETKSVSRGTPIHLTPLYGVYGQAPLCSLLELDGFRLLLDCGWSARCEASVAETLARVCPAIDAVLLSHGDIAHAGALPAAFARCGLRRGTPVVCTAPCSRGAQLALYDLFACRSGDAPFTAFSLEEVDAAFAGASTLKYTETLTLPPPLRSRGGPVALTPYPAGRTLGGAIWRLAAGAESVVYAAGWCVRGERHTPAALLGAPQLRRPSLLIMDAAGALALPPPPRAEREAAFCGACEVAVLRGGAALVPCEPSSRGLELLLALDAHWAAKGRPLASIPIVFLSAVAHSAVEFAAAQLEWMPPSVATAFEADRVNPFTMRHVVPCASVEALQKLGPGPKVVLASTSDLRCGPARALLAAWAGDGRCALVLVRGGGGGGGDDGGDDGDDDSGVEEVSAPPVKSEGVGSDDKDDEASIEGDASVLSSLLSAYRAQRSSGPRPLLSLVVRARVALRGEELARWRAERVAASDAAAAASAAAEEAAAAATSAADAAAAEAAEAARRDAEAAAEAEAAADAEKAAASSGGALALRPDESAPRAKAPPMRCLFDGVQPPPGSRFPLFPFAPPTPLRSDYGDELDYADFPGAAEAAEAGGGSGGGGAGAAADDDDGAPPRALPPPPPGEEPPPLRLVVAPASLPLAAVIVPCHGGGSPDGRAIRNALSALSPRRVALIHGSIAGCESLLRHCEALPGLAAPPVAPSRGARCDLSASTPSFLIRLGAAAAAAADEAAAPHAQPLSVAPNAPSHRPHAHLSSRPAVAWIDGCVVGSPDPSQSNTAALPSLDGRAAASSAAAAASSDHAVSLPPPPPPRRAPVWVGSHKLSDLSAALAAAGVGASFSASGVLSCGGGVSVTKATDGSGALLLDGPVGEEYYRVRELMYAMFSVV